MTDSIAATVPVEIWRRIFEHALDHPKLHYSCDPKDLYKFMTNYSDRGDDTETIFRSLRAVCRSWKVLAEEFVHREALLRIRSPTSTCLHLSRASRLQCHWFSKLPPGSFRRWLSEATPKLTILDMTVRVDGESENVLIDTLSAAASLPNIRSLRLRWPSMPKLPYPPSLLSQISIGFKNLVSLEFGVLTWSHEPIVLPKLEILIMELWLGYQSGGGDDFTHWSLPALRMLGVRAGCRWHQELKLDIFRPIAAKVEALSIIYLDASKMRGHTGMTLFENFPALRILFIRDAPLIIKDPVPISHPLMEVHLSTSDAINSIALLASTRLDYGGFDRKVLLIADSVTWKDLTSKFSNVQVMQQLIERHLPLNLVVVDKHCRNFEEPTREEGEIQLQPPSINSNTFLKRVMSTFRLSGSP
jgi:hypothetical protein